MDTNGVNETEPMTVESVREWYEARVAEAHPTWEEPPHELLRPRLRRVGVLLTEITRLSANAAGSQAVAEVLDDTLRSGGWPTGDGTWKGRLSVIERLLVRSGPEDTSKLRGTAQLDDDEVDELRTATDEMRQERDEAIRVRDEVMEAISFLRAGCLKLDREELIARITAVGESEYGTQAGWLTQKIEETARPLREERDAAREDADALSKMISTLRPLAEAYLAEHEDEIGDDAGRFWIARCAECDMDMPFGALIEREQWVEGHASTGHKITLGRSWRAGEFEPEREGEALDRQIAVLANGGGISRLFIQPLDAELVAVGDPVEWPDVKEIEVSIDLCGNEEWEPGGRHSSEERRCPDDGACHHGCATGPCWRVFNAGPLSGAGYPDDLWPGEVRIDQFRRAAEQPAPMLVPDRFHPEAGSTWENCYGKPYRWVEVVGIIQPDPDVGHAVQVRDVVDTDQPEHLWVERLDKFLAEWIDCGKPEEGCTAEAEWLTDHPMFTEEMIANAQQDVPFWPNPIRWARHEILVWRIAFNPDLPHDGAVAGKLVVGTCRQGGGSPVVDDAVAGDGGVGVAIRRRQPGDRGLLVPNYEAEPANALVLGWKVDGLAPLWLSPNRAKQVLLARLYHSRFGGWLSRREFGDAGVKECVRPPCPPIEEQEIHGVTTVVEWVDELADWPTEVVRAPLRYYPWVVDRDEFEATSQVPIAEGRHEVGYRTTAEQEALYRRYLADPTGRQDRHPKPGEIGGVHVHVDGSIEGYIALKGTDHPEGMARRLKGVATHLTDQDGDLR